MDAQIRRRFKPLISAVGREGGLRTVGCSCQDRARFGPSFHGPLRTIRHKALQGPADRDIMHSGIQFSSLRRREVEIFGTS